ncbi:uncharacterized protein LOC126892363 isoform X2 [Diabrotica virgifera virgifera]|uniref:Odorant receptor n=1 Tax=Diabrotica virgifera virgifera TaxID=50390 RepID=A0ABM5L5X5_DIAVI|nr:uncharacterized protein LOC126892363 isoform X2 [Diabrotica virgifera virgifera]
MLFERLGHRVLKTKDIARLFLWAPKALLKSLMLWPEKGMNLLLMRAYYIFLLSINLFVTYGIVQYTITYKDQFDKFAYGLCVCIIPILHLLKGPATCYNIKKMDLLVEQVMQYFWPYDLLGGHSQKYIESLFSYLKTLQLSFFILGLLYIGTILSSPLILATERSLPFPAKFDFDHTVSPVYEIMYVIQSFFIIFVAAILGLGVDLFVLAMCACAASQFKLVGHCFSLLGTPAVKNVNHKLDNMFSAEFCGEQDENKKLFIRCVKHQERLFRFVKDLNEAFNFIELGQLLLSLFGVCLNAFILLSANLTSDYLFNSNWWSLDKKLKKDIAFVLQHSQRVQQLSAYKLYDMNMTSWMKVLKLAFSLFTVLNRVLK